MKKILLTLALSVAFFIPASFAFATPTSVDYNGSVVQPLFSQRLAPIQADSFNATNTAATSTLKKTSTTQLSIGSLSGILQAVGGFVQQTLVNLASQVTGVLGTANGGTASSTPLGGILKGNGTGAIQSAVGDTDYQKPISLTTTGSSGAASFTGDVLNIPQYAGGAASTDFNYLSNYGVVTAATSSPIWAKLGVFASSTSQFDQINVGSSTLGTMSTSTFFGNVVIKGNATSSTVTAATVTAANFIDTSATGNNCIGETSGVIGTSNCVASIASAGGSLTVSSPTGNVDVSINTAHANTWGSTQVFSNPRQDGTLSGLIGGNGGVTYAVSTSSLNASITGNAATVTTNANLSGAVTSSGSNVTAFGVLAQGLLGNPASASTIPTAQATSTLYGPVQAGKILAGINGVLGYVATTTAGTGLTYTGTAFNVNNSQSITTLSNLTTNGFVTTSAGIGTLGVQTFPIPFADGGTNTTLSGANQIAFINAGNTALATQSNFQYINNNGLMIGTAANSGALFGTSTLLQMSTSTNNFAQAVIQNTSTGSDASADYVAGGNLETNTTYFGDFGCNGQNFSLSTATGEAGNDCFLTSSDSNLDLEAASTTGAFGINFFTGGLLTANKAGSISNKGLWTITNASTTNLTASQSLGIPNSSNPTPTFTGGITQSTNAPYQLHVGNAAAGTTIFDPRVSFTFGTATSTSWTGSTTAPTITIPSGLTWTQISCTVQPNGATLNAQYQYANPSTYTSVLSTMIPASTTPGVYVLSSNNTPTTNATSTITFGTPVNSPTSASCTLTGTVTGT